MGLLTLHFLGRSRRQFGSVEKMPSGPYRARYHYDGAWLSAPRTFSTKADANPWLSGAQTDLGRGIWVAPQPERQSLQSYAEGWLKARSDLRPTTRAKYEYLLDRHVFPRLGRRELARVTAADIQACYQALAGVGDNKRDV
jgi:Phage integrase, N-terminal SAM-like domain